MLILAPFDRIDVRRVNVVAKLRSSARWMVVAALSGEAEGLAGGVDGVEAAGVSPPQPARSTANAVAAAGRSRRMAGTVAAGGRSAGTRPRLAG
ncbi:hypothetical protein GCM10023170_022310 [Phytohabitans houttuyneae]